MDNEARDQAGASALARAAWRKSRYSGAVGNCVEVAPLNTGEIAVRNSRHPSGTTIVYTRAEMAAFMSGVKDGEFDDLLG
ncbi:MAG TPA: DUF397 domain-containing protein [Pseudonocardiaceae bacterium]|jgi:hypothetical protein|nr:DUF397 domain-containing protein [Pseudonocardiaceae bacterium]